MTTVGQVSVVSYQHEVLRIGQVDDSHSTSPTIAGHIQI
jgi:hypothetical protein